MNHSKPKKSRIILPVVAVMLLFLILIWVSYFRQYSFEKADAIRFGIQRNSNLAVAFEQYTISTLRNADAILQMIRMEYNDGDSLNIHELMAKNSLSGDIIDGMAIIDGSGRLKMSSIDLSNRTAIDFSDQSYFPMLAKSNSDSLIITWQPESKFKQDPEVVISRRLTDAQGVFSGAVLLFMKPSTFTLFYAQSQLMFNDILSLIAPNGITYARRTGSKESSGENIIKSPLFEHVAHQTDSFYFAPDAIRGIPSWFSYRKLKDYPIIATVGSSEEGMLADFKNRQMRYIVPRVIISILVILISVVFARFNLHRREVADHLLEEKNRYQRLLTEQMIEVQEREREWIGRELHDNVNQVLTSVKLTLETASLENGSPLISRSIQLINSSISEIRKLSHQLSAPTLGTRSLVDSIHALIENFTSTTSIKFHFSHTDYTKRVVMSQKLALYRILQEQLNNIVKYAGASEVFISLAHRDEKVVLTVKDNGKGFDPAVKRSGMGINNMVSRASVFEGEVEIRTAPGKGCLLRVAIPAIALDMQTAQNHESSANAVIYRT